MNMEYKWQKIIQYLAILTAVSFWGVSVMFSKQGFGINLQTIAWLGYVLAAGVTVMQLILNRGKRLTPTLYGIGILAYVYGIGTNVFGIIYAQVSNLQEASVWNWTFAGILGAIIEIVPEPLFLYGIGVDIGDLVSSLMQNPLFTKGKGGGRTYLQTDGRSDSPQSIEPDGHTDGLNPAFSLYSQPASQTGVQFKSTRQLVRTYVARHMGKGRTMPSVRDVAKALGKDRSTVGEIMTELRTELGL